jgi:hypothetical protein
MSIVLVGSTSGSITLQEPAVAGTTVLDLPATSGTVLVGGTQNIPKSALPTGSVLQVVNGSTTTQTSTNTSTLVDTGLSATITPTSSTSKILVIVDQNGITNASNASDVGMRLALLRNGSSILTIDGLGPYLGNYVGAGQWGIGSISTNYLDSPSTTSAVTYKTQFSNRGVGSTGTVVVQQGGASTTSSTITLMEIAA